MDEAILAYQNRIVAVNAKVKLSFQGKLIETSVGRILLNDILPESLRFVNEEMTKKDLKVLMSRILETIGQDEAAKFADRMKDLTFKAASRSAISWGMNDLIVPKEKAGLVAEAEAYPELKANTNFLELQRELSDTENKIQASRRFYNGNVMELNTKVEIFGKAAGL
jgi:DNA-directed RNA polymerase beta' subunit